MAFEAMKSAAQYLGWKINPPNPDLFDVYSMVTIFGYSNNVPVRLDRCAAAYTFTTNAFLSQPLRTKFLISAEGIGDAIAHFVGFHDVEIGDPMFDKKFKVTTDDPDGLKRLLTPELKHALYTLQMTVGATFGMQGFQVSQSSVSITRVYPTNWITPQNVVFDIPIAVSTIQKLKDAASQTYR